MIWMIARSEEIGPNPLATNYRFVREVLGADNISLRIVEDDEDFNFVAKDDVVWLRAIRSFKLISTLESKDFYTTAETSHTYALVSDKAALYGLLKSHEIDTPTQYSINDLEDGKTYFVKPRFGEDSKGISKESICHSPKDVVSRVEYLSSQLDSQSVIEDFIPGVDYTVACSAFGDKVCVYGLKIENEEEGGIQTYESKAKELEYCSAATSHEHHTLCAVVKKIFEALGIKHHARLDFRHGLDGKFYLIDINLMPGIGPTDHFAKAFLLNDNISYSDTIRMILHSASRPQKG